MKLRDIKEFIRVMIASVLTLFDHLQEMFTGFINGLRNFGKQVVHAVGSAVTALIRNIENLVRAMGRGIGKTAKVIADRLKLVTNALVDRLKIINNALMILVDRVRKLFRALAGRVVGLLRALAGRIRTLSRILTDRILKMTAWIRERVKHFHYTVLLPGYHRLVGLLRYSRKMILIAGSQFITNVRNGIRRARRAFLKVWYHLISIVVAVANWLRMIIVEGYTRVYLFFNLIARAFYRLGKWIVVSVAEAVNRISRAFRRCDIKFFVFFFLAVGGYWYFFINTYHRIVALILSFIIYHLTIETIILPIIASVIIWINTYHPVIALMKRSGLAFLRVWYTSVIITLSFTRMVSMTIRRSAGRCSYSLIVGFVWLKRGVVLVFGQPVEMIIALFRFSGRRIVNGWISLFLFLFLVGISFRNRTVRAGKRILSFCKLVLYLLTSVLLSAALKMKRLVIAGLQRGYIVVRSAIRRTGTAILAILVSLALGLKYITLGLMGTAKFIFRLMRIAVLTLWSMLKRAYCSFRDLALAAGRALRKVIVVVGMAMVRGIRAVARKVILLAGIIAGILSLAALSILGALRAIGHAGKVLAAKLENILRMAARQISKGIRAVVGAIRITARFIHGTLVMVSTSFSNTVKRMNRAVLAIFWGVTFGLLFAYRSISRTARWMLTSLSNMFSSILNMIGLAFFRVGVFLMNVIVMPLRRTGQAFSRTAVSIGLGVVVLVTIISTGLYVTIIKLSMPVLNFMARNMLAWHRFLFTVYFMSVKFGSLMVSALVAFGRLLVSSTAALLRWTLGTIKLHYRGIRDISLIFSPSLVFLLLYLALGSLLFLGISIVYVLAITASSYIYNRYKEDELNV